MRFSLLTSRLSLALYSHPPFASLTWSGIRRIGQSRVLSLTIVVPFLGSLLLFNQHVVDLLTLSPDIVVRLLHHSSDIAADTRHVTLARLYYLYFGLSFLGIGSFLFALLCPQEIKSFASAREYAQAEASNITNARFNLILENVADQYVLWMPEPPKRLNAIYRWALPHDFEKLSSAVVSEVFEEFMTGEPDHGQALADPSRPKRYVSGIGLPMVDVIAETLSAGRRVERGIIEGLRTIAYKGTHREDVLRLFYMGVDNCRVAGRLVVATFYLLGFSVLLVPTIVTFVQLVVGLV